MVQHVSQMGAQQHVLCQGAVSCVQGRVTDHRVAITEHGIDSVMSGERLAVFADALQLRHQAELLAQLDGQ